MKYETEYRYLKVADLVPAPYNPREEIIPGSEEYNSLKRSIEEHGLVEPLVINLHNMRCIGGNQRLTVIRDLGWDTVLCSVVNQPDELQEKKLCLALNRIDGRWDNDKLGQLLRDDDVVKHETGFSEDEAEIYRQLEDVEEPDVADEDELLNQFGDDYAPCDEDYDDGDDDMSAHDDEEPLVAPTTLIRVGNLHFKCEVSLYRQLIEDIRDSGIFEERKIAEEIKRRLLSND